MRASSMQWKSALQFIVPRVQAAKLCQILSFARERGLIVVDCHLQAYSEELFCYLSVLNPRAMTHGKYVHSFFLPRSENLN